MSNKNTKTPVSKATDVAEDEKSTESDTDNIITSEFVIVSSDERSETGNNQSASKNSDGKASSKDSKRRKNAPSAKMLNLIKARQQARQIAELEAEKEVEKLEFSEAEEEYEPAQTQRDKTKVKEKNRIRRQREEGSYLTKEQRRKYRNAQIQLGAAGIAIPMRHTAKLTTTNTDQSGTKRILYDDRRKGNRTTFDVPIEPVTTSTEFESQVLVEDESSSADVWEQIFDQGDADREEYQILSTTDDSTDDDQLEIIGDKSEPTENTDEDSDHSLSTLERVHRRLERYHDLCEMNRPFNQLRAPVICVLGHVDAGKTSILDNLRQTHVQAKEAGGITQQIGATNVPLETIRERTKMCRKIITQKGDLMVPGLLIIDTPGHETFKNLRSRGSSLCDLAILVVDIMHGLAPQTIESIQLLKERKTPFIIALNKVDLLYGWRSDQEKKIESILQEQTTFTLNHFEKRCNQIIVQFAEQGLNVALHYENSDPTEFYSMVPTSARTGDGMGSLIAMIVEQCQTSLSERITYTDELQATVMEVKKSDDLGSSIDVALVNGCLSVGDKIMIAGQEGPIVTRIREIRIPESNQELRVTNQYQKHKSIQGACGIKILAHDLEKSMAGFPLFVVRQKDEIEYYENEINQTLRTVLNSINLKDSGVYVQASTLGSLEALLLLLKTDHIPYAGINIGPVHRRDVVRAGAQLEKDVEYATILAFDVKVEKDAQEYANTIGVKILQNDEIYRLHDMYKVHRTELKKTDQEKYRHLAVFPCKLKILPHYVFNKRDPIICGIRVEDGFVRLGTPICVPSREGIELGRIVSIEKNHKSLEIAPKGAEVCIKIEPIASETPKMYGRHFDDTDVLVSRITRESIDILKGYFRDEMQRSDWKLILELKNVFQII